MRALITGGAGFIGSHLAQRLLDDGCEVVVVDNLSTGSRANVVHLNRRDGFELIIGDIRDKGLMDESVRRSDVVYHLAAAVGVQLIADSPVHTIETNIGGTEIVLAAANKYGRKILLASSSEVYGKSVAVPFDEDDDFVLGSTSFSRWAYACSKAIDEFLGLAYHQEYGLPVVIGRFFNTIGPRQTGKYGMVVPRFVEAALNGRALEVFGTGEQTRCFCYVGDLAEALVMLMADDAAVGRAYNIGSDEEISISALADRIIEMTTSRGGKTFIPYDVAYGRPIEDMMRRVPGLSRIRRAIGWRPRTSLEDTLALIIEDKRR